MAVKVSGMWSGLGRSTEGGTHSSGAVARELSHDFKTLSWMEEARSHRRAPAFTGCRQPKAACCRLGLDWIHRALFSFGTWSSQR